MLRPLPLGSSASHQVTLIEIVRISMMIMCTPYVTTTQIMYMNYFNFDPQNDTAAGFMPCSRALVIKVASLSVCYNLSVLSSVCWFASSSSRWLTFVGPVGLQCILPLFLHLKPEIFLIWALFLTQRHHLTFCGSAVHPNSEEHITAFAWHF